MELETRYAYEKRIRELQDRVDRLENDIYQFRTASSEIYEGCIAVLEKSNLNISVAWVLGRLKRAWRP